MTRATFRPHERLKDPADFRRAFDRKRSVSDAALVVYGVENGRDHARLGISVSRKKVRLHGRIRQPMNVPRRIQRAAALVDE